LSFRLLFLAILLGVWLPQGNSEAENLLSRFEVGTKLEQSSVSGLLSFRTTLDVTTRPISGSLEQVKLFLPNKQEGLSPRLIGNTLVWEGELQKPNDVPFFYFGLVWQNSLGYDFSELYLSPFPIEESLSADRELADAPRPSDIYFELLSPRPIKISPEINSETAAVKVIFKNSGSEAVRCSELSFLKPTSLTLDEDKFFRGTIHRTPFLDRASTEWLIPSSGAQSVKLQLSAKSTNNLNKQQIAFVVKCSKVASKLTREINSQASFTVAAVASVQQEQEKSHFRQFYKLLTLGLVLTISFVELGRRLLAKG